MIHRLLSTQVIPRPLDEVWEFFSTPKNLNVLTPSEMSFEFTHGADEPMHLGQLIEYRVQILPLIKATWLTEITHLKDHSYFVDEQRIGPYQFWYHEHRFTEVDDGVEVEDIVHYALPLWWFGRLAHWLFVRRQLQQIFHFRRQVLDERFPVDHTLETKATA